MNLDASFIERLLKETDLSGLQEARIEPDMLFDKSRDAFVFIRDFYAQYGKLPDAATVEASVGLTLNENTTEPLAFYADQVKERWVGNVLKPGLQAAASEIAARRPKEALERMKEAIAKVSGLESLPDSGLVDLRSNTAQRLAEYEAIKARGGMIDGLPTPWPILNQATMGVHKGELWFFVARTKMGKCLREGTLVPDATTGKLMPIEDVVRQHGSVLTLHQDKVQATMPTDYWNNGVRECMRLETRLGNVLEATTNEPMLTPDGWKHLDQLRPGDRVAAAARIPEPLRPVRQRPEWVDAMAGLFAEGGGTGHGLSFTNMDEEVATVGAAVGGFGCALKSRGKPGQFDIRGTRRVGSHNENLVLDEARRLGLTKLAREKELPAEVFALPNDQLARFLGILWSCDGSVETHLEVLSYSSASEKLIDGVRHLLLRFGVVTKKCTKHPTCGGRRFLAWELHVQGQSRNNFMREIACHTELSWLVSEDIVWDEVVAITPIGKHQTYDLTVEPSHCYVAAGLVVHNSWAEFVLAHHFWTLGYKALVISMEMSLSKVARRIDAIAAQIPYGDFKSGKMDQVFEDRFRASLDNFAGVGAPSSTPLWLAGNGRVRTAQDVDMLWNELEPDVVLVDGMYLMQPSTGVGRNGGKWERVAGVADDLQKLAQRRQMPLIATSQFGRKVGREVKDATSGDIGFAFELAQNCLPGDTLVSTSQGFVKLAHLWNKKFEAWNGVEFVPATAMFTGEKPVLEVRLSNGQVVRTSGDHRFLTLRAGRTAWVEARDLKPGAVLCRMPGPPEGDTELTNPKDKPTRKGLKFPKGMNGELATWLGLLTGDGYVRDEREWVLAGHVDDNDVTEWFETETTAQFGVSNFRRHVKGKTLTTAVACREMARFCYEHLGLTRGLAHVKEVPFSVLRSIPEHRAAFLRGLFEADGYVDTKTGRVSLCSVSPKLARQVHVMLQSLGIPCCVVLNKAGRLGRHPAYRVEMNQVGAEHYAEIVGFLGERKQAQMRKVMERPYNRKWHTAYSTSEIALVGGVTATGEVVPMFDVSTSSKEHMFCADGLAVHNCDCMIGMFQDEEMRTMKRMLLRVLEHREGEPVNWMTNWNFSSMDFSEIGIVSGEELSRKDKDDEDSRVQF